MMRRSLLYILHGHDIKPDVKAPEDRFQEVYRSTYGKVRIFKIIGVSEESKKWCDDPANWHCDVPGSWFCPGSYPPGLNTILARKKDFKQLEDFNRGGDADHEYQQQYFKDLHDPESARRKILEKERKERLQQRDEGLSEAEKKEQTKKIDEIYNTWADTEETTMMWRLISSSDVDGLKRWLEVEPHKAFVRSKDGRGPMWWAFEQRNEEVTKLLMKAGVPHTDKDAKGLTPVDLLEGRTM
jgi:dolichyl-diphosphooligosaccharide--protein glycosyltransferase